MVSNLASADVTIDVTFDASTGAIHFSSTSSFWDAINDQLKLPPRQSAYQIELVLKGDGDFRSITFNDYILSKPLQTYTSQLVLPQEIFNLAGNNKFTLESLSPQSIVISDENGDTAQPAEVGFQVTVESSGQLYTSRDPQIINEKDG